MHNIVFFQNCESPSTLRKRRDKGETSPLVHHNHRSRSQKEYSELRLSEHDRHAFAASSGKTGHFICDNPP